MTCLLLSPILKSFKKNKLGDSAGVIGAALIENIKPIDSFRNAFATDPVSAFGGVIACNFKITNKLANEINKNFLEVILAKGFDKDALALLKKKKNLRIIDITGFKQKNLTSLKAFDGSFLLQSKDQIIFNKKKLKFATKLKPTKNN